MWNGARDTLYAGHNPNRIEAVVFLYELPKETNRYSISLCIFYDKRLIGTSTSGFKDITFVAKGRPSHTEILDVFKELNNLE
jgi:hypothetical protein